MKKRKLSLDERDDELEEEAKEMTISSAVGSTCGLIPCLARLIEEYAVTVEYIAGDWCLVEQPVPCKRYNLGLIKKIVMDRKRRVWVWIAILPNRWIYPARVPYIKLYPTMIDAENNQSRIDNIEKRNTQKRFLRIVASGSRDKMKEMFRSID
jgi:hypothetical protein